MIEVKGQGGQVQFDDHFVTITRKGFLARATLGKGEKRIPIAQITAVQWKPAGPVMNGFIQFTLPGGVERRSSFGSQTKSAANDENSVIFTKRQQPAFEKLRAAVEDAITQQHAPSSVSGSEDFAGQLAKLQALVESGVLSEEEFQVAKARLLGQ